MGRRSDNTPPAQPAPEATAQAETPVAAETPPDAGAPPAPATEPAPDALAETPAVPPADTPAPPPAGTTRPAARRRRPETRIVIALLEVLDALVEIRDDASDPEKVRSTGLLAAALLDAGAALPEDWTGHTLRHALLPSSTNAPADPEGLDQLARALPTLLGCFTAARRLRRQGIPYERHTGAVHLAQVAEIWPAHTSKAACDAAMGEQFAQDEQARQRRDAEAHAARAARPRIEPARPRNTAPVPDEPPDMTVG